MRIGPGHLRSGDFATTTVFKGFWLSGISRQSRRCFNTSAVQNSKRRQKRFQLSQRLTAELQSVFLLLFIALLKIFGV